jgi:hypothetical protein
MSNVLSEEQKQQLLALGRLGWSMRRIEQETEGYRETVARYLRQAGIAVRKPGRPSKESANPAIFTSAVTPDSPAEKPSSPSACAPFGEVIAEALARGRNAKAI